MRISIALIFLLNYMFLFSQVTDSLWDRGIRCYKEQDYHGTIYYMDSLLQVRPQFPEAYYNRGVAKINLGNIEEACSDFSISQKLGNSINEMFFEYECNPDFKRDFMIEQFYKKEKVYPENGYRPKYTASDSIRGSLRVERTCFNVTYYDLNVRIIPAGKKIKGTNDIWFTVIEPTNRIQIDLFDNFKVTEIRWNNNILKWQRKYNALFIDFPQQLNRGEKHIITITYQGKPVNAPNPPWDGGFVWKRDDQKNLWIGVACEHLGASSWWPNKDHLSDKPDSMQLSFEVRGDYKVISNGNLRQVSSAGNGYKRFTWFVGYPINNYNATFYVGKYIAFNDTLIQGNDTLRFDFNVLEPHLKIAKDHFKQAREVIEFYNNAFGFYPFPNDGFSLVESPYEGMEHQSAIAYGHGYTKNNANDYRNNLYDYIIVHEAAHEWWGNSVTAEDMADIWIHEGFATYAEYLFLENRLGKDDYFYELSENSHFIFNVWPLVENRGVNENTFASNDVYNKGAMILHCLRCIINDDKVFFGLIKEFCITNKYKIVNSNDFISFVNSYTNNNYEAFFRKFLYDIKLPVLEYSFERNADHMVIKYKWSEVESGFQMPFGIETDNKESLRILGNTEWQEIKIPNAKWFNFYNLWKGYDGAPENSFTYYRTKELRINN